MSSHHLGRDLSLLRRGVQLGMEFGLSAVEAIGRVAEIVEASVYEEGSLARHPGGIVWRIRNPPLRMGAFYHVRILLDGAELPPERVRFRVETGGSVRSLASVNRAIPLTLAPGIPVEFTVDVTPAPPIGRHTIRLELRSVAIPPRVWFEFTDELWEGSAP